MSKSNSTVAPPPAKPTPTDPVNLVIPQIEPKMIVLDVEGISPLVVQNWDVKAANMILEKQMKKASKGKEAKNPEALYAASLYNSTEGWTGVPAGGVRGCLVNACRLIEGLPMTLAKRMIFILADGEGTDGKPLVRINGGHRMWQNPVRIPSGADIRFRARYDQWTMRLSVQYLANVISAEQVANLIEFAGYAEGLCEWRPGAPKSNTGTFGRFKIKRAG